MTVGTSANRVDGCRDRRSGNRPASHALAPIPLNSGYGLRDLLNTVFREKRLIFWVFLVTFSVGAAIALRMKPIYSAQARLLVLPSREYTLNPEVGDLAGSFGFGEERMIRSETEILKNSTLVDEVIKTLGIGRLYPELEKRSLFTRLLSPMTRSIHSGSATNGDSAEVSARLAERKRLDGAATRFNKNLEIEVVKDSSVIGLTFAHPQADLAIAGLATLIQRYLDFRTRVLLLPRSKMFIEQRDGFARRLDQLEQDIEAFKLKNNISLFADQRSLLLRQYAETNSTRMETQARLGEVEGRIGALRDQLATMPKQSPLYSDRTGQDPASTARSILASLEARRNELLTKFTPKSQFITDIDEQIANLRATVAATPPLKVDSRRSGPNPVFEEINTDRLRQDSAAAALRSKQASLDEQIATLGAQLVKFDELEKEYNTLTLNREILEKNLRTYAQKVEESLLQE